MLLDVFGDMGIGRSEDIVQPLVCFIKETEDITLRALFSKLSELCRRSEKPVVLMIDEVDSAGNNQVFIDFLAHLRRRRLGECLRSMRRIIIQEWI